MIETAINIVKNTDIMVMSGPEEPYIRSMKKILSECKYRTPKRISESNTAHTVCSCGHVFSKDYGNGRYSVPLEKRSNYCPDCGQRYYWN